MTKSITNRFIRWLTGVHPDPVGVYWGRDGLCLVRLPVQTAGGALMAQCVYEASALGVTAENLTSALGQLRQSKVHLSVALPADEVIVRSMRVPVGLSDLQIEQIAIVEAVTNIPVPPEEICLDFLRADRVPLEGDEIVQLAFCRRERIDQVLACAEEANVQVAIVDRDMQAIHDVVVRHLLGAVCEAPDVYPFAVLLTAVEPRVLFCMGETDISSCLIRSNSQEGDPVRWHADIIEQISVCWTRIKLAQLAGDKRLQRVVYLEAGIVDPLDAFEAAMRLSLDCPVSRLPPVNAFLSLLPTVTEVPEEAALIALGMAIRKPR